MNAGVLGGWIGAIVGSLGGITGGAIGTYFAIKNTNGPRERRFTIRAAAIGWIAITLFLILMFTLPRPYNMLLWIPHAILLPFSIN